MPEETNDYYGDGEQPASNEAPPSDNKSADETDSKTALLPLDICPDAMKPGDELTLKVVRVHDDQYEVEYSSEPKGESEELKPEPMAEAPTASAGDSEYD